MTNENCLQGIKCPNCESEERFGISVSAFAYFTDNGSDEVQDMEWDDSSAIVCCACNHSGTVSEFTIKEGV